MKGGCYCTDPPVCHWCPPSRSYGGLVEWREGVLCVVPVSRVVPVLFAVFPVFGLDPAPRIVQSLLHCIPSCRAALFFFVLLCCVRRTEGRCVWSHCECCVSFPPPSVVCVRCHSIVGLGSCLCDRVVSLWNSGDGLCWVEGRVGCGVLGLHIIRVVAYISAVCV